MPPSRTCRPACLSGYLRPPYLSFARLRTHGWVLREATLGQSQGQADCAHTGRAPHVSSLAPHDHWVWPRGGTVGTFPDYTVGMRRVSLRSQVSSRGHRCC